MRFSAGFIGGILAGAAIISVTACRREQSYEKPIAPVKVAVVESFASSTPVKYSGSVEARLRVDLAFRVGGYIQHIETIRESRAGAERLVQEGDPVVAGAVLARLRDTEYSAKVSEARAGRELAQAGLERARFALRGAEANLEKTRLDNQRASHLFEKQSLTKPELDAYKAADDAAQAQVDGLKAELTEGQARIEGAQALLDQSEQAQRDCSLSAPTDGLVLKRSVEVGSLVSPGMPAFSIMDIRAVKVVFGVPDLLVNGIRSGEVLPVTTEAVPGMVFDGRITAIAPAADPRSRVFEIEVTVPNADRRLKPGMIASLELKRGSAAPALPVVPLPAVVKSEKGADTYSVFVVSPGDGRDYVHARSVSLGDAIGNRVAVLSGVRAGERVVVSGATLLRDGEPVRIVP